MPDAPNLPEDQLEIYRLAVQALGGINKHARAMKMSERHGRALHSGEKPVSRGILADTAVALQQHSELCRALEKKLTPAFTANLTERQLEQEAGDGRGRPRGSNKDG